MFPHPDIGKDLYRTCHPDFNQMKCSWQAAIALAMMVVAATLFDLAVQQPAETMTASVTHAGGR
jgi:hypothetical protein